MLVINPSMTPHHLKSFQAPVLDDMPPARNLAMEALLGEVKANFGPQQLRIDSMLALSKKLQAEMKQRLQSSPQCMLPSHNYTLPHGKENGTFLAMEVGGSTLRVALVALTGKGSSTQSIRIRRIVSSTIDSKIRAFRGLAFFDWIAEKIGEMLAADRDSPSNLGLKEPLPLGIAWSFPIEYGRFILFCPRREAYNLCSQTSIRSGNIIGMGKGFVCDIYKGHDLGDLIEEACHRAVCQSHGWP